MTVEFNSMIIQISQSDDLDTLPLAVCVFQNPPLRERTESDHSDNDKEFASITVLK